MTRRPRRARRPRRHAPSTVLRSCDPAAPSCAALSASFITDARDLRVMPWRDGARGNSCGEPGRPGHRAGEADACGGGRRGGHAGRAAGRGHRAGRGRRRGPARGPHPGRTHPARTGAAPSWRIIKTTRGRDLPGVTAVTATGPDHAWAFASTLARPVAWRLTGHRWAAVPFPGQAGDLVTAAASSARDNVGLHRRPAGAGRRCAERPPLGGRRAVHPGHRGRGRARPCRRVGLRPAGFTRPPGHLALQRPDRRRYPAGGVLTGGSALSRDSIWAWAGSRRALERAHLVADLAGPGAAAGHAILPPDRGPGPGPLRDRRVGRGSGHARTSGVRSTCCTSTGAGGGWCGARTGTVSRSRSCRTAQAACGSRRWPVSPAPSPCCATAGVTWRPARLPLRASQLAVGAVAHVAGSAVTFGGGASYRPGHGGTKQSGVVLRYGG